MKAVPILTMMLVLLLAGTTCGLAAASDRSSKRSVADGGRTIADYPGMDELLDFEFEGISLRTRYADVPRILAKAGYVQNPLGKPYMMEFYRGDLVAQGSQRLAFTTRPGGRPGYVIRVQTDLETKSGAVKSILFVRPSAPRYGPPFAERLPDSLDVKLARELKAIFCRHIADERERWATCPPDTDTRVEFRGTKQVLMNGDRMIRPTFNVTNDAGTIGLGVSP